MSRASPFGRDASATPVRQTQRFVSLRYLALHYGGFTGSNIKASSPAQPPPFRSRRYAPRPAETGTEGRTPRLGKSWLTIPACFAGRVVRTMLRASHFATDSALRAARTVVALRVSLIALGSPAGGRTKCAVRQGRTVSLADGGQTQDVSQDRSGILVGPPLTFLRQVQANRPPAGAGCIFVWSVGNRHRSSTRPPNIKADSAPHAYAQPIADTPETLSPAGAIDMHGPDPQAENAGTALCLSCRMLPLC